MAEKLSSFPDTVELLCEHQIGYHSSSHSIHPTLFEFTDVESYEEAYQTSIIRETAHINPVTGEVEGSGGIQALRRLFPKKQIDSFRAPGYCWTPPHLDAMKTLGIKYDFSTNISIAPVQLSRNHVLSLHDADGKLARGNPGALFSSTSYAETRYFYSYNSS